MADRIQELVWAIEDDLNAEFYEERLAFRARIAALEADNEAYRIAFCTGEPDCQEGHHGYDCCQTLAMSIEPIKAALTRAGKKGDGA